MLCQACAVVDFTLLIPEYPNKRFHVLHQSRQSFLDSLAVSCQLCLLISGKLDHAESCNEICQLFDAYMVLGCLPRKTRSSRDAVVEEIKSITVASRRGPAVLHVIDPIPDTYSFLYADPLRTRTQLRSHVPARVKGEPGKKRQKIESPSSQSTSSDVQPLQDLSTGSTTNFQLARTWLDQCLSQHSQCEVNRTSMTMNPLPTRVVNVAQADRPFLEVTDAQTMGPYAVLSYVWGGGKRIMSVKSNYDAHKKCLSVEHLPLTIADAIQVTRGLGYKYIWIDALCIIQDDQQDLDRELPKMGDIYRFAQLTICAEGAESSHAGLFANRDSRLYRPCKIPITISADGGPSKRDVTLATTWAGPDYLKSRGWVLQERVLSSRCLMFGQQMAWTCTMGHAQETRLALQPKQPLPQSSTQWVPERLRQALYAASTITGGPNSFRPPASHFDIWYSMLEEYGDRELTFVADNIPALSGLAAMFHQTHGTTYLAGLWKEDLQFGLAWYVAFNDERPVCDDVRGPSWSWASVGKVRIKFRSWRRSSETLHCAEVVNVAYDTTGMINPYGFVTEGTISLRAPLKKAILENTPRFSSAREKKLYGGAKSEFGGIDAREQPRYPALLLHHDTHQPVAEAALDRDFYSMPGAGPSVTTGAAATSTSRVEVWCALLHAQRDRDRYHETLLVLERNKSSPTLFKRLGLGFLGAEYSGWFGTQSENETGMGTKEFAKETVLIA